MKNSFKEFELNVKQLSNPNDFEKNKEKLKELRLSSFETFISLLLVGGEIVSSIKVSEEIFKISSETHLCERDITKILCRARSINAIIDEKLF